MVTNIKEGKTKKCEQYWPEAGSGMRCGPFNLSLVEQHIFADYTIRTIQLDLSVSIWNRDKLRVYAMAEQTNDNRAFTGSAWGFNF